MESEGNKQDAEIYFFLSFFLFENISCIKMV